MSQQNIRTMFTVGLLTFVAGTATGYALVPRVPVADSFASNTAEAVQRAVVTKDSSVANPDGTAFTIPLSALSEGQRTMVAAMGISGDAIVVTNAMYACAEAKLGGARIGEIKNGATPTAAEGAQLMACYQ